MADRPSGDHEFFTIGRQPSEPEASTHILVKDDDVVPIGRKPSDIGAETQTSGTKTHNTLRSRRTSRTSGTSHTQTESEGEVLKLGDTDLEEADLEVVKKILGIKDTKDVGICENSSSRLNLNALVDGMDAVRSFRERQCRRIAGHQMFTSVFMILTFYALFVPDLDDLLGNKRSREFFLISNTFVCLLFFIEILVLGCSAPSLMFFCKPYFWLDMVALVSLLPDTWAVQTLIGVEGGELTTGRSARLARIIKVAMRTSKVTRMAGFLVRAASIIPSVGKLFGKEVRHRHTEDVLNKKLRCVFRLFDKDMEGLVSRSKVTKFLDSLKVDIDFCKITSNRQASLVVDDATRVRVSTDSAEGSVSEFYASTGMPGPAPWPPKQGDAIFSGENSPSSPGRISLQNNRGNRRRIQALKIEWNAQSDDFDTVELTYDDFRKMLIEDDIVGPNLNAAVDHHLRKQTNTRNMTSKHSEYVAVRVALGVIILLALIGVIQHSIDDQTRRMGLANLEATMRLQFPNATPGGEIPEIVHSQVEVWNRDGVNGDSDTAETVVWLDFGNLVYCNAFKYGAFNCTRQGNSTVHWQGHRPSWADFQLSLDESPHRKDDINRISVLTLADERKELSGELSDDQIHTEAIAVGVIVNEGRRKTEAALSLCTTLVVIVVILIGIALLTQDLNMMSSSLLQPLGELADDMESLVQLQLAGAEEVHQEQDKSRSDMTLGGSKLRRGPDEIMRIRNTFEKMKKALKSWGKYVPWPVVQTLLRANVEADLDVEWVDISTYFSDIAGFTGIVESLSPEMSLRLLNRYFNDMTKIIDEHGGVVIEFIGDAILCIYGTPLENPEHPSGAVKAAMEMLAGVRRINKWSNRQEPPLPEVNIRCGLHSGNVMVGNMGFKQRIKYGVVGEAAQLPSRLEELNKTYSTSCLISNSTYRRLMEEHFVTRPVDKIRLTRETGSEPENIHEVMACTRRGKEHPLWPACTQHTLGMDLYAKRQWVKAIDKFEKAREMILAFYDEGHIEYLKDGPTELLIKRCRYYMDKPPSEPWDGVWVQADET